MLPGLMDDLKTWARFDMAWAQRYAVTAGWIRWGTRCSTR
jgi:hypothetical protein